MILYTRVYDKRMKIKSYGVCDVELRKKKIRLEVNICLYIIFLAVRSDGPVSQIGNVQLLTNY